MINENPIVKSGGKTNAATRLIDIPDVLCDYLKTANNYKNVLVCPSAHGKMMSAEAWKRMCQSYLCDLNIKYGNTIKSNKFQPKSVSLGIPHFTAHWLRHTYTTMLYLAVVDVLTAKEQLGHSNITTTLNIYTHLDSKYKKKHISKLNDFLKEQA